MNSAPAGIVRYGHLYLCNAGLFGAMEIGINVSAASVVTIGSSKYYNVISYTGNILGAPANERAKYVQNVPIIKKDSGTQLSTSVNILFKENVTSVIVGALTPDVNFSVMLTLISITQDAAWSAVV